MKMNKMVLYKNSFILFLLLFSLTLYAQNDKNVLKKKKEKLESIIKQTSSQLNETKKNKQSYLNQISILNKQISARQELISSINLQINDIDAESAKTKDTISSLARNLEASKKEYARIVYQAFKSKNEQSTLMFIFSSKSFNQAYLRIKYMQQYTLFRKQQAAKILGQTRLLSVKLTYLEFQKREKLSLLTTKESEKVKLFSEKEEQNFNINQLSQKEKMLLKTMRTNEEAVNALQNAIERIIAEEVKRANDTKRKTYSTSKTTANAPKANSENTNYVYSLTTDEINLSSSFEKNKGKLPWPVDKGTITDFFGEQPHAELKGIMIKNNGVNIETSKGASAKVIFNGVVTGIISIPNLNNVVIIRHGEFLSVYSNLKNVTIYKGEKVKTLQALGTIQTDPSTNKTKIHFEIWKGKVLLNPVGWLLK